jgi:hypothetical protein
MTARASDHHIKDRWLPYLEGLLSPEENRELADHLLECRDCASRLEEMGQWASLVTSNRQAICPEGWELLQYERTGEDPLGIIASHVETCAQCGADLKSFKDHTVKQGVPRDLWEKMERLQGEPLPRSRRGHWAERLANLLESVKDLFRPTVLVPAAVAAMVLILVVYYPGTPVTSRMVALSSVTWGPAPDALGLMSGQQPAAPYPGDWSKEAIAIAILLTNFKQPIDQDRINSFYRALEPPLSIRDRYAIISPAEWRSAISREQQALTYDNALLAELRSKLRISQMLTVELTKNGERFSLKARLEDTATENIVRERDDRNLTENELVSALENISQSMLHN